MSLPRVAVLSLHTSPLDQPGRGDSGGMNVYIRSVAEGLARQGVEVDIFTRCAGRGVPEVDRLGPGLRVIQIQAGPCAPVAKDTLPGHVPEFADALIERYGPYDLLHAHYWLSGWAGRVVSRRWEVPLVATFHTLGRVKNRALAPDDAPEPPFRLDGEEALIREADRIVVPAEDEARDLVALYRAAGERIRVVPPGVDGGRFFPASGPRVGSSPVALFVGRLQPHKAPDLAIRTVAAARRLAPALDLSLVVVGGPSGTAGYDPEGLRALASDEGMADRVRFLDPVPHEDLPALYRAADVVLIPSRSESFGLVALESQACGVPVVAADVSGLRTAVGEGGILVPGHEPADHAEAVVRVLTAPGMAAGLARRGLRHAAGYSWDRTTDRLLSVYGELVPELREPRSILAR